MEEGDSRGRANVLIIINTSTPCTQEYLNAPKKQPKKKKHQNCSQNCDTLLGYVTFLNFVILKGGGGFLIVSMKTEDMSQQGSLADGRIGC